MVAHAIQDRRGIAVAQYGAIALFMTSFVSLALGATFIALLLVLVSFVAGLTWEAITRPPSNNAANFLSQFRSMAPSRPVLVCLGDSLTQGKVSDNWTVKIAPRVAEKMKFDKPRPGDFQDPVWVVNSGQNSLTSWVVLQERLQSALACYPDYIVVMIGSNDVLSMISPSACNDKMSTFNLPEAPNMPGLRRNLTAILEFLTKASPKCELGMCTIPPIGENLSSPANKLVKEANEIIHSVVEACTASGNLKVSVLSVGERLQNEVVKKNGGGKKAMASSMLIPLAVVQYPLHYSLGLSWKSLTGMSSGSVLHDTLHLNEDGGDVVADVVTEWLFLKNVHKAIAVKQF